MSLRDEKLGRFHIGSKMTDEESKEIAERLKENNEQLAMQQDFEMKMRIAEDKKITELWKDKEIMPFGFNILIRPFDENPYIRKISDSGIITDSDGIAQNPNTGEMDLLTKGILYAVVEEVGPDVKHVRKGDEIIYAAQRILPMPFKNKGFCIMNEGAVLAIINTTDNLKGRFNN